MGYTGAAMTDNASVPPPDAAVTQKPGNWSQADLDRRRRLQKGSQKWAEWGDENLMNQKSPARAGLGVTGFPAAALTGKRPVTASGGQAL